MAQLGSGEWNPFPLPQPTVAVRRFVDWEMVYRALANSSGGCLGRALRTLLLNHWLKGVEKGSNLQYSQDKDSQWRMIGK